MSGDTNDAGDGGVCGARDCCWLKPRLIRLALLPLLENGRENIAERPLPALRWEKERRGRRPCARDRLPDQQMTAILDLYTQLSYPTPAFATPKVGAFAVSGCLIFTGRDRRLGQGIWQALASRRPTWSAARAWRGNVTSQTVNLNEAYDRRGCAMALNDHRASLRLGRPRLIAALLISRSSLLPAPM
jgi:hypothetical protein